MAESPRPEDEQQDMLADINPTPFTPTLAPWRIYHCRELGLPTPKETIKERVKCDAMTQPAILELVTADGNCFYRCISIELTGSQNYHRDVRQCLFEFMEDHVDKVEPYICTKRVGGYLSQVKKDKTWATEVEVVMMATMLQTPIVLFRACDDNNNARFMFHTHGPLFTRNGIEEFGQSIYMTLIDSHFERILE